MLEAGETGLFEQLFGRYSPYLKNRGPSRARLSLRRKDMLRTGLLPGHRQVTSILVTIHSFRISCYNPWHERVY
jgi:hypothetical protein